MLIVTFRGFGKGVLPQIFLNGSFYCTVSGIEPKKPLSVHVLFLNWHLLEVKKFKARPQNRILVPLRGSFQNF